MRRFFFPQMVVSNTLFALYEIQSEIAKTPQDSFAIGSYHITMLSEKRAMHFFTSGLWGHQARGKAKEGRADIHQTIYNQRLPF
jgi:hypothetical protein